MTVAPNLYVRVSLQQLIQLHVGRGHASLGSSRDDLLNVNKNVKMKENDFFICLVILRNLTEVSWREKYTVSLSGLFVAEVC
jgi:hypothetical protein